ncbi:thioredoxin-like domain-containing protein [Chloroflexota bacterium]
MKKWVSVFIGLLLVVVLVGGVLPLLAQDDAQEFSGQVPAPPFPEDLEWLNVPAPLTWEDLAGKVVLLDFWTYGCINCIHIIPDLKQLEEEFAEELVVIGVHSAKFDNEGDTENIRQIVQRYEVEHPVVNDNEFSVWRTWGVNAWPTAVVVDPQGNVFGFHSGEGVYQILQPVIAGMVEQFDAADLIDRTPVEMTLETDARLDTLLAFPGKVLADEAGNRLFIADSNHNRIVVADLATYEVLDVIGGTQAGNTDGSYVEARFNKPQGMDLSAAGTMLYVADTENHTLRAVDLNTQDVSTIAGTGYQARYRANGGTGTAAALNSPWDLVRVDDILYIAMAGPHQLWRYDLATGEVAVHSGSGGEGLVDDVHSAAELAQPSGITTDGDVLYFADSEASAIRTSDVDPAGQVSTLVGTGLFDFGDQDGIGDDVLLQHPLGVEYVDGQVYVADTYNSKLKVIDPVTRATESLAGDITGGYRDGTLDEALFDEPGGVSHAAGNLYVADTNNHAIRVVDLAAGTVESVVFPNPEVLQAERDVVISAAPFTGDRVTFDEQPVAVGEGTVTINFDLPEGYKLNDIATSTVEWQPDGEIAQIADDDLTQEIVDLHEPLTTSAMWLAGEGDIVANLNIYYCEAINESLCFIERVQVQQMVQVTAEADSSADLAITHTIVPPQSE